MKGSLNVSVDRNRVSCFASLLICCICCPATRNQFAVFFNIDTHGLTSEPKNEDLLPEYLSATPTLTLQATPTPTLQATPPATPAPTPPATLPATPAPTPTLLATPLSSTTSPMTPSKAQRILAAKQLTVTIDEARTRCRRIIANVPCTAADLSRLIRPCYDPDGFRKWLNESTEYENRPWDDAARAWLDRAD